MNKIGDIIMTLLCSFIVVVVYYTYGIYKFITDKEFRKTIITDIKWKINDIENEIEKNIRA